MNKIIGYKRKERNFWPYAVLALVILFILSIAFMRAATVEEDSAQPSPPVPLSHRERGSTGGEGSLTASTSTTTTTQSPQKKENTSSAIEVEQITLTSGLTAQKAPVDDLAEISKAAAGSLYCYIKINCPSVPQTIRHVWIAPDDEVAADVKLFISNRPAYTWSYVSLYDKAPGRWKVRVVTPDDVVLAERSFLLEE